MDGASSLQDGIFISVVNRSSAIGTADPSDAVARAHGPEPVPMIGEFLSFLYQAMSHTTSGPSYEQLQAEPSPVHAENRLKDAKARAESSKQIPDEIPEEPSAKPGEHLCATCMDRSVKVAWMPCGHTDTCVTCSREMWAHNPAKCPICNQGATHAMRIYISTPVAVAEEEKKKKRKKKKTTTQKGEGERKKAREADG